MCISVWKMRDKGTLDGRKLLWLRGTLLFVSVIGFCLLLLCLCNFETQKEVLKCMKNARQGNTAWKKIALAEGNPLLCLCDWILCDYVVLAISKHCKMCACVWKTFRAPLQIKEDKKTSQPPKIAARLRFSFVVLQQ